MRSRNLLVGLALVLTVFLSVYTVSAGIGDWFGRITGHATSSDTNVTVSLAGANPVTVEVFNSTLTGATVTPTENNLKSVELIVRLTDVDGAADINATSVSANFSKSGEALRQNSSCVEVNTATANSRNFSCTIDVWYFDAPGTWSITAGGTDFGNLSFVYNTTQTFLMATTTAMVMSPASISFGSVSPGAVNQTATDDPTVLNNTGNANITNITVTPINLYGQNFGNYIDVANFSVGNNTGSSAECDTSAGNSASLMVNGSQIQVGNAQLLRGNHSANNGQTGQEQLYYCFNTVPQLPSDAYSPPSLWTVTIV
ncbi:MAG: hypothetical protein KC506_03780 [Nanoarchaeota archaeon]|nr:hypothetical protein [Nanoarchaeota archaeon]